ncbi:MAG: S8 family serine peptidase, partial [Pirellula staleyi]
MIRVQIWRFAMVAIACHLISESFVAAQGYKTQVGFDQLKNEVGPTLANGSGITVGLVEANVGAQGTNTYFPNTSSPEFGNKTFVDESNLSPRNTSGHATTVGQFFFGNSTSMSPGVTNIHVYDASNFVGVQQALGAAGTNPAPTSFSVVNHSYIGNTSANFPVAAAVEANARLDYTITRDNFTSVVALGNSVGSLPAIYGQSNNSIVVGRSDGQHSFGLTNLGVAGRTKPDIVAPGDATSFSTPIVSSAAALLHSAANDFGMTNARNSEAMKAIIMGGASKA